MVAHILILNAMQMVLTFDAMYSCMRYSVCVVGVTLNLLEHFPSSDCSNKNNLFRGSSPSLFVLSAVMLVCFLRNPGRDMDILLLNRSLDIIISRSRERLKNKNCMSLPGFRNFVFVGLFV